MYNKVNKQQIKEKKKNMTNSRKLIMKIMFHMNNINSKNTILLEENDRECFIARIPLVI